MARFPTFTVILATYNWSSVLPFSIGSALLQTLPDFELLVIGDGCSDDSEQVVRSIEDPRVRWINLPSNSGHQSEPNNEGLRQARGAFIAYLGHDDLWFPHHLSTLKSAFDSGADLTYTMCHCVGAGQHASRVVATPSFDAQIGIPPTTVGHRREIVDRVGYWKHYRSLSVDPDAELWQRMIDAGYRCTAIPRLSAIKFPAAWRRNVYRTRPNHEQAKWLRRMREGSEAEWAALRDTLIPTQYAELAALLWRQTLRRLRLRLGWVRLRRAPKHPDGRIDLDKRFKGAVSPAPGATNGSPDQALKHPRGLS